MRLSLIVAMSENGVIGREGDLPWRLSADLRRFKRITMGHHLLMGRRTYASIGRPLPGRTTVVISRVARIDQASVQVARSLESAIQLASGDDEPFIVGGGQIFQQALPVVDRIYLTMVQACVEGDVSFPQINWGEWQVVEQEDHAADARNEFDYSFRTYDRLHR